MSIKDDEDVLQNVAFVKFLIYAGIGLLAILLLVMGSCTMHSNTFDEERILANAEYEKAEALSIKASNEVNMEKVKAIERLINSGVDPIVARCAVMGWDSHTRPTCDRIAK